MKKDIQYSPEAGSSGSSEPVKRLAERYHIPEKDVEALLYGSRAPKSEALGSDTQRKSMADEFRSGYGAPPQKQSGWSPINILSAIVGVLGIMALTIILVAVINRHEPYHMGEGMHHPPMPMMAPPPPAPIMPDTSSRSSSMNEKQDEVPPPAESSNPETKPAAKPHHRAASHASSGFSTSNSVEAQERLAEMRADGNSKARIRQSTKNGVTIYSIK